MACGSPLDTHRKRDAGAGGGTAATMAARQKWRGGCRVRAAFRGCKVPHEEVHTGVRSLRSGLLRCSATGGTRQRHHDVNFAVHHSCRAGPPVGMRLSPSRASSSMMAGKKAAGEA